MKTFTRACDWCGEPFTRPVRSDGIERQFCSPACRSESMRKACEPKRCAFCGETFERPPRLSVSRWLVTRYCSRRCVARGKPAIRERGEDRDANPLLMYPELPILPRQKLTHREIGALLDMSHNAVAKIERKVLARLKKACGE
jgi:hypothetical protein